MLKSLSLLGIMLFIAACAANPEIVERQALQDQQLSCQDLRLEMSRVEQIKIAARQEDRFKMRYITIIPAIVSVYRFDQAEKAADERIAYLQSIYNRKNCK